MNAAAPDIIHIAHLGSPMVRTEMGDSGLGC
jgi:hypothetical protein